MRRKSIKSFQKKCFLFYKKKKSYAKSVTVTVTKVYDASSSITFF